MKLKTKIILTSVLVGLFTLTTAGLIGYQTNKSNGWFDNILNKFESNKTEIISNGYEVVNLGDVIDYDKSLVVDSTWEDQLKAVYTQIVEYVYDHELNHTNVMYTGLIWEIPYYGFFHFDNGGEVILYTMYDGDYDKMFCQYYIGIGDQDSYSPILVIDYTPDSDDVVSLGKFYTSDKKTLKNLILDIHNIVLSLDKYTFTESIFVGNIDGYNFIASMSDNEDFDLTYYDSYETISFKVRYDDGDVLYVERSDIPSIYNWYEVTLDSSEILYSVYYSNKIINCINVSEPIVFDSIYSGKNLFFGLKPNIEYVFYSVGGNIDELCTVVNRTSLNISMTGYSADSLSFEIHDSSSYSYYTLLIEFDEFSNSWIIDEYHYGEL